MLASFGQHGARRPFSFVDSQWLKVFVLTFILNAKPNSGSGSSSRSLTVNQYDTVTLDCFSVYNQSSDWYFHDKHGGMYPLFTTGHLQPANSVKVNVTIGSGFTNLTIYNVSFANNGRYECREGWDVKGRPRQNIELQVNDFDECVASKGHCDPNANCINTMGSFNCTCNHGFAGDGFSCDDINECNNYPSPCGTNAGCMNKNGSFLCTCEPYHIYLQIFDLPSDDRCTAIREVEVSEKGRQQLMCRTLALAPIIWLYKANESSDEVHLYRDNRIVDRASDIKILDADEGDYSLVIENVERNSNGYYVCVNMKDGTRKGYFLKAVSLEESDKLQKQKTLTGVVAGTVWIPLVAIVLVFMFCYKPIRKIIMKGDTSYLVRVDVPGEYEYQSVNLRFTPACQWMFVFAQLPDNLHLALTAEKDTFNENEMYEVFIGGGEGNLRTAIRKGRQSRAINDVITDKLLDGTNLKLFWVSWNEEIIRVGSGHVLDKNVILEGDNDPSPSDIHYVSVSSFSSPGLVYCVYGKTVTLDCINVLGGYVYSSVNIRFTPERQWMFVFAQLTDDLHLALTTEKDSFNDNEMYEVVIDGWRNKKSAIRKSRQGTILAFVESSGVLDASKLVLLWVSWRKGCISVGSGHVLGKNRIIKFRDKSSIPVNYVSVASYIHPGTVYFVYG